MYLTMGWPVEEVFSTDTDEPVDFDSVPCEWEDSDLDEYLDPSILLRGVKGDKVSLNDVAGSLVCRVRFIVPDDFSDENQQQLVNEVTGGLSDGFGESGLSVHGHNVYLDLNLDVEPETKMELGPTAMATLAVLAYAGDADVLRDRIQAAKSEGTFESQMESTLETIKPLALAVGSGSVQRVQILLDAGADPNGDQGDGPPIESTALVNKQCLPDNEALEIAQRLVAAGANVQNPKGLAKKANSRGKSKLAQYFDSLSAN